MQVSPKRVSSLALGGAGLDFFVFKNDKFCPIL